MGGTLLCSLLPGPSELADVGDADTLQELLYGLYALISVHFRKEEDLQLPTFDAAPPEVTAAVLERMVEKLEAGDALAGAGSPAEHIRPAGHDAAQPVVEWFDTAFHQH